MRGKRLASLAAVVLAICSGALADGMIVPVRPDLRVRGHWAVKYHHVNIRVRDQVAAVTIDQQFMNTGRGMIEVEYFFPVPPDAAIDSMTLMVDGKEYSAELLEAEEARRIYEDIVRKKKDPALLEYAGFGLYKTRAFPLEPNKPVKVVVTYKNICRKESDTVEVWYPLNTEKFSSLPIGSVRVKVDIRSDADISSVYSPSHEIDVDRKGPRRVVASYKATDTLPTTDFQLFYRSADEKVGATLLTYQPDDDENGYFLMLLSPNRRPGKGKIMPKDVVIVLDRSGSMGGQKIDQAREAAMFILENLNEGDRFNVIAYNDGVEVFFDELVEVDGQDLRDAGRQLDNLDAAGGTNIHEALRAAMESWPAAGGRSSRPKYVIFMTDGLPTTGKKDEKTILADTRKANEAGARLFAFGVGYDVNVRLLDKLVAQNNGRSEYVRPAEPIESKVSALYRKIKNPVMTDLEVELTNVRLRDVYPRDIGDLFDGDQIVLVGRYDADDARDLPKAGRRRKATLLLRGVYRGRERVFEYSVTIGRSGKGGGYGFVETLWATRRIGWLLDQIQLNGESDEIIDELVRLSKKHGIVTPYTSFLAKEETNLDMPASLRRQARTAGRVLREITGGAGQVAARNRAMYNRAMTVAPQKDAKGRVKVIGYADVDRYERGESEVLETVRSAGRQAIYRRGGNVWIAANAADLDPEADAEKIRTVERFSDEYFRLVRGNSIALNQVMASQQAGEELIVRLGGQAYRIR